jgi:hypothetical protein
MEELRPCPCCGEPYVRLISLGEGEGGREMLGAWRVVCPTLGCFLSGPIAETEEGARRKWNALAALAPNSYGLLYQDALTILDRAVQVSQEADWLAMVLANLGCGVPLSTYIDENINGMSPPTPAQWREAARKAIGVDLGMEEKKRKE